jgi:hypothetical protein
MTNHEFYKMAETIRHPDQSTRAFFVDQIDRCIEALGDAAQRAAKGKDGKPIFYTGLRRQTRSGRTHVYSVHFFDEERGEMQSLNYVTAFLLSLRLDEKSQIITSTKKHADGNSLIRELSKWLDLGVKRYDRITHQSW